MSPRTVRLALAGCGTVGSALLDLIERRGPMIEAEQGLRFEFSRVLVRDPERRRPVPVPRDLLTDSVEDFLQAPADLVVEAIGGIDPALTIAREALGRGSDLVTANKALVAEHGPELTDLARRTGGTLAFEAAVAGGVPIMRVLRDLLSHGRVQAIGGILNGTCNFILSRMDRGACFDQALEQARAAGFAEADPTRDLVGLDAADKIGILAWQAFGVPPAELRIRRIGIVPDPDRLVATGLAFGGVVRLVAECRRTTDGAVASVEPVLVARGSALARVRDETNFVWVRTTDGGTVELSGPGAGGYPTALSVLSDVLHGNGNAAVTASGSSGPHAPDDDTVRHRWIVSLDRRNDAADALLTAADAEDVELRSGIHADARSSRSTLRALTPSVARPVVHRVCEALRHRGHPCQLVRYALDDE